MSPEIPTFHDMREDWMLQQSIMLNIMNALKLNYIISSLETLDHTNPSQITLLAIDKVQRRVQLTLQIKKVPKSYQAVTCTSCTSRNRLSGCILLNDQSVEHSLEKRFILSIIETKSLPQYMKNVYV